MVELEYHAEKIDQHEVWSAGDTLTLGEVREYEEEMQSMIEGIRDELSSLECKLEDAVRTLKDSLPKCEECGEELEDGDCPECDVYVLQAADESIRHWTRDQQGLRTTAMMYREKKWGK